MSIPGLGSFGTFGVLDRPVIRIDNDVKTRYLRRTARPTGRSYTSLLPTLQRRPLNL